MAEKKSGGRVRQWFENMRDENMAVPTPELDAAVGNAGAKKTAGVGDIVSALWAGAKEAGPSGSIANISAQQLHEQEREFQYDRLDRLDDKKHKDTFVGQFGANRTLGRLSQDANIAWSEYARNPTKDNRDYAEAVSKAAEKFQLTNAEALDDVNAKATLLTKDLASYLPQFKDQTAAQIGGGALGLVVGGGPTGAKVGAAAASGMYSANVMRGAAFKTLLDLGIDEDTARKAANDEAFISGLLESGDTLIDLATLGTGKLITTLGKGTAKTAAKAGATGLVGKMLKGLGKYGLNITEEGLQEGLQQAISIANAGRVEGGDADAGKLDLARRSLSLYWDRLRGEASAEDTAEIKAAEAGGARLAALLGGAAMAGSAIANRGVQQRQEQTSPLVIEQEQKQEAPAQSAQEQVSPLIIEGEKKQESVPPTTEQPPLSDTPEQQTSFGGDEQPTGPFHPINEQAQQETQAERGRGPVEIPIRDINGQLTPKTASTLANAKITPNDFAAALQKDVEAGKFPRIPFTDAAAIAGAEKTITDLGWNEAMKQYESAVRNGQSSKSITTLGITLYNNALNSGTPEGTLAAMNVASLLIENSKTTAQAQQAMSIINKLSPEGRLYMVVRSVENIQQGLAAKFGEKAPNLKINPELLNEYRDALVKGDEAAAKEAMTNITKDIASQVPATWQEQLQAWRYLAMLGNFRTQVRNIVGNLGFVPFRVMKNALATVGEQFLPEGMERTKAILNRNSAADMALLQVAGMDYANVEDAIMSGGKYQDGLQSEVDKERTIFNNRLLEGYRKFVGDAMNKGDTIFSRRVYTAALAMYLKANGFTAADFTNGKMSEEQIARAREVAIQEAARATYRDASWLSEGLNKLTSGARRAAQSNGKGSGVAKVGNLFVEGVLPFKKTPANVLARAIDYSPAGIIKGVVQMHKDVKAGKSAAEAIDSLAAGLTGTGVMLLGAFLRNEGILSGSEDEDDKQAGFDSLQGQQNYALTVGDKNYTIDWLAPGAVSLFVGAEIMDAMQDKGLTFREVYKSLLDIADPIVEMSMLSGVQDMLETGKYGDAGLDAYIATMAMNYLSQFIPTLFGQIERSTETGREETYRYNDEHSGVLGPQGQRFVGTLMNKLPTEYNQVDYIDAWGRTQDYEKGNFFNQMFNPSYISSDRSTAADSELQRLYDLGYTSVFPQRFAQSDEIATRDAEGNSIGKRHLTAEEYEQFNRTMGATRLELAESLIGSAQYKNMSNDEKAKAIENIYAVGKAKAMLEVDPSYKPDSWVLEALEAKDPAKYIGLYSATQKLQPWGDNESVSPWQKVKYVAGTAGEDADDYVPLFFDTDSNYPKKYELARERGYSAERFAEFYEAFSTIESDRDANGKSLENVRKKVIKHLVDAGWPEQYANEMYNLFKADRTKLNDWRW